jgi:hypothetical protein
VSVIDRQWTGEIGGRSVLRLRRQPERPGGHRLCARSFSVCGGHQS